MQFSDAFRHLLEKVGAAPQPLVIFVLLHVGIPKLDIPCQVRFGRFVVGEIPIQPLLDQRMPPAVLLFLAIVTDEIIVLG